MVKPKLIMRKNKPLIWLDGVNLTKHYKMDCTGMIYCIRNKIDGRRYIGQSRNIFKRIRNHRGRYLGSTDYAYIEMRQFDWFDYEFSVIEKVYISDGIEEFLDQLEEKWIAFYDSTNSAFGYNKRPGGLKSSIAESSIELARATHKRGFAEGKYKPYNKGMAMSDEQKALLCKAHGGKKEKRSEDDFRRGVRASVKTEFKAVAVKCIETGKVFPSVSSAARFMGVRSTNFTRVWKNPDATVCGLHWEKVIDYQIDSAQSITNIKLGRKIECIETGIIYDSVKEACIAYGVDRTSFAKAWKDPEYTIGGAHWRRLT